jgi:hypothetical protein
MRQPKIVKIKYEVVVATFNQEGLIQAQDSLYALFDEVLYNSVSDVAGVDFLVDTTELKMEGEIG